MYILYLYGIKLKIISKVNKKHYLFLMKIKGFLSQIYYNKYNLKILLIKIHLFNY